MAASQSPSFRLLAGVAVLILLLLFPTAVVSEVIKGASATDDVFTFKVDTTEGNLEWLTAVAEVTVPGHCRPTAVVPEVITGASAPDDVFTFKVDSTEGDLGWLTTVAEVTVSGHRQPTAVAPAPRTSWKTYVLQSSCYESLAVRRIPENRLTERDSLDDSNVAQTSVANPKFKFTRTSFAPGTTLDFPHDETKLTTDALQPAESTPEPRPRTYTKTPKFSLSRPFLKTTTATTPTIEIITIDTDPKITEGIWYSVVTIDLPLTGGTSTTTPLPTPDPKNPFVYITTLDRASIVLPPTITDTFITSIETTDPSENLTVNKANDHPILTPTDAIATTASTPTPIPEKNKPKISTAVIITIIGVTLSLLIIIPFICIIYHRSPSVRDSQVRARRVSLSDMVDAGARYRHLRVAGRGERERSGQRADMDGARPISSRYPGPGILKMWSLDRQVQGRDDVSVAEKVGYLVWPGKRGK